MSKDDKDLFKKAMQGVTPLRPDDTHRPVSKPKQRKPEPLEDLDHAPVSDGLYASPVFGEDHLEYMQPGIQAKTVQAIKRGRLPIEAMLDLHGFRAEAARQRVATFIQQSYQQSLRCVIIVHGKGGKQGEPSILKTRLNTWLPQFVEVLGFVSAQPKDGGRGAVYVLLKRQK